jgi:hypothetical protein
MKYLFVFSLIGLVAFTTKKKPLDASSAISPLSIFSDKWNDPQYRRCNTAEHADYMTAQERQTIYILNLLRSDPGLFANTVVKKYPDRAGLEYLVNVPEYKSLLQTLKNLKPLPLLYPDSLNLASAQCHAISSGAAAYVGHIRRSRDCDEKKNTTVNAATMDMTNLLTFSSPC